MPVLRRIDCIPDQVVFSYTPGTAVCEYTVNCTDVQIYRSLQFKLNLLSCQKLDYLPGQQALILHRTHKLRFRVRHKREIKNEKNNQIQQTYTVDTDDYLTGIN